MVVKTKVDRYEAVAAADVRGAFKNMKNNKSASHGRTHIELLKNASMTIIENLLVTFY